ncbi:hypothetical protein TTHERM_000309969 (macronuclear) [Tetrahymena thermophila SB210]|uniref:Uncharacterized protein n=1 Tax=Tetrahymena thermophila (strain SB210) TaxID=312017 RepID=W7X6Z3_TETTS|nr:hypothetical protein TTHERM_000309969 [Tetrahymena thermophila SB210]EWS73137.1 hypothetical protein TTHERM_000309969 [Tetrahymena thermophila SB210]|eukprot:XP_012654324.1 hypothetical protein TTHERM_000309969 [Tetrahymena thermophila SB210]
MILILIQKIATSIIISIKILMKNFKKINQNIRIYLQIKSKTHIILKTITIQAISTIITIMKMSTKILNTQHLISRIKYQIILKNLKTLSQLTNNKIREISLPLCKLENKFSMILSTHQEKQAQMSNIQQQLTTQAAKVDSAISINNSFKHLAFRNKLNTQVVLLILTKKTSNFKTHKVNQHKRKQLMKQ